MNTERIDQDYEPHAWEPETQIMVARPTGKSVSEATTRIMTKTHAENMDELMAEVGIEVDLGWLDEYAAREEQVA